MQILKYIVCIIFMFTVFNTYAQNDTIYLAKTIQSERVPGNKLDMLGVGSVVMIRLARNDYPRDTTMPNTIQGVVEDPGQFDGRWSKRFQEEPDEAAMDAARRILKGYRSFGLGVVYYVNTITATNEEFLEYLSTLEEVVTYTTKGATRFQHTYYIKP